MNKCQTFLQRSFAILSNSRLCPQQSDTRWCHCTGQFWQDIWPHPVPGSTKRSTCPRKIVRLDPSLDTFTSFFLTFRQFFFKFKYFSLNHDVLFPSWHCTLDWSLQTSSSELFGFVLLRGGFRNFGKHSNVTGDLFYVFRHWIVHFFSAGSFP